MAEPVQRNADLESAAERGVAGELRLLSARLSAMSGLAEAQLAAAIDALGARDTEAAEQVVAKDLAIDELETEINARAMGMLTRHAPVAADLREIVAALKISSNVERIGDYAANVAKRAVIVNNYPAVPSVTGVIELGRLVRQYVQTVFDAYVERNTAKADAVWRGDAEIDALHTSVFQDLLSDMLVEHDHVLPCTHLLFCIKNLERIGDHATNIAETIQFLVAGKQLAERRPKAPRTTDILTATLTDPQMTPPRTGDPT
ncbi:MAG: phosphate signaling complex protein PhoU [Rhodospirillaceae bacterium]|nr:phosphate signaling complex protein PhoU [Rhodospirillaceae bacterium]